MGRFNTGKQPSERLNGIWAMLTPEEHMYTTTALKRMRLPKILWKWQIGHIRVIWYNTSKWQLTRWDLMLGRLRIRIIIPR